MKEAGHQDALDTAKRDGYKEGQQQRRQESQQQIAQEMCATTPRSRQQWYQTYSHRWLTPERTPPAPQP